MSATTKRDDSAQPQQQHEPAKGGTKPASDKPRPSGDSPKPHGDKFEHAVEKKK